MAREAAHVTAHVADHLMARLAGERELLFQQNLRVSLVAAQLIGAITKYAVALS